MDFVMLALRVFLLDQGTKRLAEGLEPGGEVVVVKNALSFTNVQNRGAAMGLLQDNPKTLMAFTAAAAAWCAWVVAGLARDGSLTDGEKAALACLAGGALGNLTDRLRRGRVTDFIQVKLGPWKKAPVFNLADMFILFGAASFVRRQWTVEKS